MSLMFPRSSFHRDSEQIVSFQSWMSSRMRDMTGPGNGGGRSGKRRTSSLRNSLVEIWRWKGYPHVWTSVSRSASASMATWGLRWLTRRAMSIAASRGLRAVHGAVARQCKESSLAVILDQSENEGDVRVSFLLVNVLCDFEVEGVVWFVH